MDKTGDHRITFADNKGGVGIFVSYILIIIFAAAIFGTYTWQHRKVNSLSKQVTSLSSQVTVLQNQKQQLQSTASQSFSSLKSIAIKLYSPVSNSVVSNPLAVVGEVPGNWSFEASFPVILKDSKGNVVAQTPAQVLGDWTTTKLVLFSAKLTWSTTQSGSGTLILQKDNPSGLAANDDSLSIPVKF